MIPLTDEQQMLVESVDRLAREEFADDAFDWAGEVPAENLELLADRGFLGVNFDEEYGGGGMSEFESLLVIETVGRVCPDTAQYVDNTQMIAPRALEMLGTETAKEKYLPPVLAGEEQMAVAISEPGAGSDVKAMETTVEEDGDELVLNGEKLWVSFVPESRACVVWAQFPEGLGTLVIEFDWPGVEIQQHYTNMAGHPQTQFTMDDVVVPEENVMARGEKAFKRQLEGLNWERLGTVAFTNAMAECAIDRALDYAGDREQFGQPIGEFQGIEWKFADMAKQLEVSRALCYQAARLSVDQGRHPDPYLTSIGKLYSAEMIQDVVSEALQIHGANGYMQDHPLEYLYRLARGRRIGAGTDETVKNSIASLLKKRGIPHLV